MGLRGAKDPGRAAGREESQRRHSALRSSRVLVTGETRPREHREPRPLQWEGAGPRAKDAGGPSALPCTAAWSGETDPPPPPAFLLWSLGPGSPSPGSGPASQCSLPSPHSLL